LLFYSNWAIVSYIQGRIQDFKLGGGGGWTYINCVERREARTFLGFSCEKSRFYAKNIIFFPILGGGAGCDPWIRPWYHYEKKLLFDKIIMMISLLFCMLYSASLLKQHSIYTQKIHMSLYSDTLSPSSSECTQGGV
jgi:hypothetical protein